MKCALIGLVLFLTCLAAPHPAHADTAPHGGLFRQPDVSARHIVFVYGGDLWIVPREGGVATPLASPPGEEGQPRFSPDGREVAFVGDYGEGAGDVYVVPVEGGVPRRVTNHPDEEWLSDWTPQGELLFSARRMEGLTRQARPYLVSPQGGLPTPLPVPYGALATISPSGRLLAYCPQGPEHPSWKRYRGGRASDVWVFDLEASTSRRLTDWEGTDAHPMWQGEDRVFFVSDAGDEHRLNLWSCDLETGARTQWTHFDAADVRWPAIGPGPQGQGEIVFQIGDGLRRLDLATGAQVEVPVQIPGARPTLLATAVDVSKDVRRWAVSPHGKRAVVEARGDVWTLPAKHGVPRNLTATSGVAERDPAWSPDGRWIAYFSDATGEYELWIRPSDGKGEARRLTTGGDAFRFSPVWSPDSKRIAFTDKAARLWLADVASGDLVEIDQDPIVDEEGMAPWSFSPDSRWIAYARVPEGARHRVVFLYDIEGATSVQLTSAQFPAEGPVFDRKGDLLAYRTVRHFQPRYADVDDTFIYAGSEILVVTPLRADAPSPFAPRSDEESYEAQAKDTAKDTAKDAAKDADVDAEEDEEEAAEGEARKEGEAPLRVRIDVEGFEGRSVPVPVDAGHFSRLAFGADGALLYGRTPIRGDDAKPTLHYLKLGGDETKEEELEKGTDDFRLSADGKHLLAIRRDGASLRPATPGGKATPVVTGGMQARIDPRAEWHQMLTDGWRIMRDFFYDPGMHGVDWPAVLEAYRPMIDDCVTAEDVGHVIRDMIGELNVGHANYWRERPWERPRSTTGLLGVDYARENGAYRIARIVRGGPWDLDVRGPLEAPGIDVEEGDYLLAVNGTPVDGGAAPWGAFEGTAGKPTTITVSEKPVLDDGARDVLIVPLADEGALRYRAWVEANRRVVEEATQGRVGYVHVPDTGRRGQNDLVRQLLGQRVKDALIVDERWNGGGQIPDRFVEMLDRPARNYWARRDGQDWAWPVHAHQGPKCMLMNGSSGSGGDAFPAYFRQSGLGPLIGRRTWGGLVGISGNPPLIDGSYVSVPTFAFYEVDGTWGIEGHGVDPDIEVIDDPARMADGSDVQLQAAIATMLEALATQAHVPPKRPRYPDRSGMGVAEEDK